MQFAQVWLVLYIETPVSYYTLAWVRHVPSCNNAGVYLTSYTDARTLGPNSVSHPPPASNFLILQKVVIIPIICSMWVTVNGGNGNGNGNGNIKGRQNYQLLLFYKVVGVKFLSV